jgi:hypothetical protein
LTCGAPTKSVTGHCARTAPCRAAAARVWSKTRRPERRKLEKAWQDKNRVLLREANAVRRAYWQIRINEIKTASGCVLCGFQSERAGYFDLDHIDPRAKRLELSKKICGWSPGKPEHEQAFAEETVICQVLCVACHREKSIAEMTITRKEKA